jgi:hypothetical protein
MSSTIGSSRNAARGTLGRRASAALLFIVAALTLASATAAPFVPARDDVVLERLPARAGAEWDAIARLRAELSATPTDATRAAALARLYLEVFRAEGDPRLVAYARHALAPWRDDSSPPLSVALERALIAQTEHRFDDARGELQELVTRSPRDAQAALALATLDTVQGRYAEAKRGCARLVLLADAAIAGACIAGTRAMTGEADDGYEFTAAELAAGSLPAQHRAWLATLAAELATAAGHADRAAAHYADALEASGTRPSVYLLTAYADHLLEHGRPQAAVELLAGAPPADPLLLRLARAERLIGQRADERVATLRYRLDLALRGTDDTHSREAAYFALHLDGEPERALALALTNWQAQREAIDAELVLAAAAAAGRPEAAEPVVAWLASEGSTHARLVELIAALEAS